MYKLVIFDLDDCLIDTWGAFFPASIKKAIGAMVDEGLEIDSFNEAVNRLNHINNFSKNSSEAITKYLEEISQCVDRYIEAGTKAIHYYDFGDTIEVLPGAIEVIENLEKHGISLAIVTRGGKERQLKKIKAAGIEANKFQKILSVEKYDKTEPYSSLLSELDCLPENVLVVGDRYDTDLRPAKNLGMKTAWIPWGRGKIYEPGIGEVDYTLSSLSDLFDIFKRQ